MTSFDRIDLIDAFDDCIDRLHAGQTIDDCLRDYPQHAATLHSLLQTASAVRRAVPVASAAARARVWAQVTQATPSRHTISPWRTWALRAAATMMIIFLGAVLATWFNDKRNESVHTDLLPTANITSTLRPTDTQAITPTMTIPVSPDQTPTFTPTPTLAEACLFTVQSSSINLRSGPGTGYAVVEFGYAGDQYTVIARHASDLWFQVLSGTDERWVAATVGEVDGDCANLPISDRPLRDAPPPIPGADDGSAEGYTVTPGAGEGEDEQSENDNEGQGSENSGVDDSDDENHGSDDNGEDDS